MLEISDNSSTIIFCIIIVYITHPSEVTSKRRVVFINSRLLYRVCVCIISLIKALSSLTSRVISERNFGNRLFDPDEDAEISNFDLASSSLCTIRAPISRYIAHLRVFGKLEMVVEILRQIPPKRIIE